MSHAIQPSLFPPLDAANPERLRELRSFGAAAREKSHKLTQCDRILALLDAAKGEWVPLPAIMDLRPRIAQYNARIFELRMQGAREGFFIDGRFERDEESGETKSWYRLRRAPNL